MLSLPDTNATKTLIIACGALAREINFILRANNLQSVTLQCLPAIWHNSPEKIVSGVKEKIEGASERFDQIILGYGDCGTGGQLDAFVAQKRAEGMAISLLPGPHCYAFYMGLDAFTDLANQEIGCFYVTDYLVRQFDSLILEGLGLKRYPELKDVYFNHYKRLVYLAQTQDNALKEQAQEIAFMLGLDFTYHDTGYGLLETVLTEKAS